MQSPLEVILAAARRYADMKSWSDSQEASKIYRALDDFGKQLKTPSRRSPPEII